MMLPSADVHWMLLVLEALRCSVAPEMTVVSLGTVSCGCGTTMKWV